VVDVAPGEPEKYQDGSHTGPDSVDGADEIWKQDYCILLPQSVLVTPGSPNTALGNEPVFIFPVPTNPDDEERHFTKLANAASVIDNMDIARWRITGDGTRVPWVPRVYHLGVYRKPLTSQPTLPNGLVEGDVRLEFRGETMQVNTNQVETIAIDPYPTYSFAFTLQRARIDTDRDGRITTNDAFSDSLYQVRVMVFKNFDDDAANNLAPGVTGGDIVPRTNVPIREFVTLISL
jgi:hypothetical protein